MLNGDSVENYREVTDAEKAALEKSDAEWVEPSEDLIMQSKAGGAIYNSKTGYFELNGLTDITAEQMQLIVVAYSSWGSNTYTLTDIRTNLLLVDSNCASGANDEPTAQASFRGCRNLEVARLRSKATDRFYVKDITMFISDSPKLREVIGVIVPERTRDVFWKNCFALETVYLELNSNMSLKTSPLLNLDSLTYMVENAINTSAITVTLHPEAYARLTDELLEKAAEKQITFITTE